jgi:hypothetical protein
MLLLHPRSPTPFLRFPPDFDGLPNEHMASLAARAAPYRVLQKQYWKKVRKSKMGSAKVGIAAADAESRHFRLQNIYLFVQGIPALSCCCRFFTLIGPQTVASAQCCYPERNENESKVRFEKGAVFLPAAYALLGFQLHCEQLITQECVQYSASSMKEHKDFIKFACLIPQHGRSVGMRKHRPPATCRAKG